MFSALRIARKATIEAFGLIGRYTRRVILSAPRRYKRQPYSNVVSFSVDGSEYRGISEDISAGGMFVRTKRVFSVGRKIAVKLHLKSNKEKEMVLHGKIKRVTKDGIGISFII